PDIISFDSTWGTEWTVGEITAIKGTLNDNNREKLEGYLAHKWSLNSLPPEHTYKNSRPTTNESPLTSDTPFDHGQAVNLANGHIEVTTGGSAFNAGSDFTISVWTKGWPSEVNASVISKGSPTTHPSIGGWMIGRGSGTNQLISNLTGVGGEQSATHSKLLSTDNSWHHIVSTFDGSVRKIFLDGEQVASTANTGSVTATNASLLFGASDFNSSIGTINAHKHAGIKIDEVRFYNTALSNLEVVELYGSGKGDKQKEGSFSTLPASITGTVGTTFSTTIDANFTNPYYSAYNLPQGLSINSATGVLSGTPAVGGSHQIIIQAESSNPEKIAVGVISYTSSAASAPILGTPAPISLTTDSATILAEIAQSGSDVNYTVELFWGSSDGGTNASSWQNQAISMGTGNSGYFGKSITGLTAGNTYFYRLRTTQGSITSWSDDRNFTTPIPVTLPSLLGQSAINITGTTADLQVELNSTGNATTEVTFYYGTSDGGTTPSSWDSNITISSANSGIVRGSITGGLNDGQTYFFKAQATNYKGSVWATLGDTTFTTTSNQSRVTPVQNSNLKGWWK
ncbi:MAG: LamG domain-containing protein, partial [Opitutae bacterium]|nr:LamG domain-containing protein [Opitutae bacterium]